MYPSLFKQEKIQPTWGVSKTGVGLVGTIIAHATPKDHIIHSVVELDKKLNSL